jgi:hypothetical protein
MFRQGADEAWEEGYTAGRLAERQPFVDGP